MKINGYVVPGVLVLAILAGVYGYGQQSEKIEKLEKTPLKVQEIAENQAGMKEKIEALARAQETFRDQTVRSLDRILRKLDE
ncbi:MAG: hypothetical protein V3S55_06475 [Nitrospiraceae bacterium]